MAITQAIANAFKKQLLEGDQSFKSSGGDVFKLALYTSSATLNSSTTAFTTSNEVSNSGTYSSGGGTLTSVTPTTSGTTAICDFSDISFTSATITARGALIYNNSKSNAAIAVLDFGSDFSSSNGTFQIQFPTAAHNTALIRIS